MLPVEPPLPSWTHHYVFSLTAGLFRSTLCYNLSASVACCRPVGQSRTCSAECVWSPVEDYSSFLPESVRHPILSLKNKGGDSEPKATQQRCALIADKIISNLAQTGNRTHQVENKNVFSWRYLPVWGGIFFRRKCKTFAIHLSRNIFEFYLYPFPLCFTSFSPFT